MRAIVERVTDPYVDGVYRWWHLTGPSPELLAARADGWLPDRGTVLDVGCGLGSEAAYLAGSGWRAVGVDLSAVAVGQAHRCHPADSGAAVAFARSDVRSLPFAAGSFALVLDRGCFHYLEPAQWPGYAAEVARVLRPGGRLLLRACLTSAGVRNEVTRRGLRAAFAAWRFHAVTQARIASDTREMPALIARLERP